MKLIIKCSFAFLSILLSLNSVYSSEELTSAIKPTTRAELPDYKSWKTPNQFEEYLEKALGKTSYNFTEIEGLVRDYLRLILSDGEKFHMDEKVSQVVLHGPETLKKFAGGESYSTVCVGLARYMSDKGHYRRFSEILEDMRYEESRSKPPSLLEWLLSPITRFTSASAGYRPIPAAVKSR
jgi:hypothetical protein